MSMESQHPDTFDLGSTHGVRQRRLRSLPALWAAEHFDAAFQEAMRRKEDEVAGRLEVAELDAVSGPLFRCIGWDIATQGAEMVAADRVLVKAKRRWRKARVQRDAICRKLYRELSEVRSIARDLLRKDDPEVPCLRGETERDPHRLMAQVREVVAWAQEEECPLDELGLGLDGATLVTRLPALHDELKTAVAAVLATATALDVPMCKRQRAIRSFDREVSRACRVLECALEIVGLPTLAAAVRPHLKGTGRVGRPSKRPLVDKHPDLVVPLRAAGLLPELAVGGEGEVGTRRPATRGSVVFGAFHVLPRRSRRAASTAAGSVRRASRRRRPSLSVWRLIRARHPGRRLRSPAARVSVAV